MVGRNQKKLHKQTNILGYILNPQKIDPTNKFHPLPIKKITAKYPQNSTCHSFQSSDAPDFECQIIKSSTKNQSHLCDLTCKDDTMMYKA